MFLYKVKRGKGITSGQTDFLTITHKPRPNLNYQVIKIYMNDLYLEHEQHQTYDKNCSTCFSEALIIETRQREWNEMTLDELHDDRGGSPEGSPIGGWIN